LVIGLAFALFAVVGRARVLAWVLCYLGALLALEVPPLRQLFERASPRAWVVIALALALPGVAFAYRARERMAEDEDWVGFTTRVEDRLRLERTPAIAPALVTSDRPQTFFIHAPGAARVTLALGDAGLERASEALGGGLFRVDYDPRRDGLPKLRAGALRARIRVDGADHERAMTWSAPFAHPRDFCTSPDGLLAATPSEETDELFVVGVATDVRRIAVGDGPSACAFVDATHVAVTHRFDASLWIVSLADTTAPRIAALSGQLGRIVFDPEASEFVIARLGRAPALLQVTWPELSERASLPLSAAADQLLPGAHPGQLIAATRTDASVLLFSRRAEAFELSRELHLSRPLVTLARSRDGAHLFGATTDFRPERSPQLGNHFVQDQLLVIDATTLQVENRVLSARRTESQTKPGDMDQGGSPSGMVELASGALAVVFAGTDELWRLDLRSGEPNPAPLDEDALYTPQSVAELSDGSLWISSAVAGALGQLAPNTKKPRIVRLAPSDRELLAHDEAALARRIGERGFYESTRSGISCQSCHMHADSDAAAYNLGDHRLVPTLSVRGLLGTSPYLRDGSYPRIEDLDSLAQTLYRGYARVQPGRRVALARFVESLPREQPDGARDLARERLGLQAFVKAGCPRCHSFPAFTNLAQLPMAALFPRAAKRFPPDETLDVPSLLSVGTSPPYLNDGRAATLAAVIDDENPDNLHGDTRALSHAERQDLLAFVSTL
jgi:hypothetical protein